MSEIQPFAAIHYNPDKVRDLTRVLCPPYDVISPERQDELYQSDELNFIRILLGKPQPQDDKSDNVYIRAKKLFDRWIQEGVLVQDEEPAVYFYKQDYRVLGQKHSRLGFISLMKIQDGENAKVYPHEKTHSRAKEDRLRLWKTVGASLSPIFVCFSDREKKIETQFQRRFGHQPPFMEADDDEGVHHAVWRVTDKGMIQTVTGLLSQQDLFIADGHHRYEVAKEYRRQRLEKIENPTGREPFQYVMTYFTNLENKGLQIFPIHRILKRFSAPPEFFEENFRVDKIRSREELGVLLAKAGKNEHAFGLYTRDGIRLLRLKNKTLIEKEVTEGSEAYRHLDATILRAFVFDKIGIPSDEIIYHNDINVAVDFVESGKAEAAFILNPVKINQLKQIALNGERMPPKTTYFYPKVISGLTMYRLTA